jgi:hypothetical protein
VAEREVEAPPPRPACQRPAAAGKPERLAGAALAGVRADRGVVDREALEQRQGLGEVARGDLDLCPLPAQRVDDRPQDEDVGRIR